MLKTYGTSVAVIDYVAVHGFCLTESMRFKQEQFYVRWRLDKHLMALELPFAAFTWDNCDFRPTTSVTGVGAHVSTISATCVAVNNLPGHMLLLCDRRQKGDRLAKDITTGDHWHSDGEQWQGFVSVFDDAVFPCAVARIAGEGGDIELRQVNRVVNFAGIVSLYVYANVSRPLPPQFWMRISGYKDGDMTHLCMRPGIASGVFIG